MESEVPELILPDPTPETANSFYCKKVGLFSRDFEVYRDPEREQDKWLVIDTEGGLFDDNAYICGKSEGLRWAALQQWCRCLDAGPHACALCAARSRKLRPPARRQDWGWSMFVLCPDGQAELRQLRVLRRRSRCGLGRLGLLHRQLRRRGGR